jgi:hypothetical protein
MVGMLGSNNAPVPLITMVIWYVGICSLCMLALSTLTRKTCRDILGLIGIVSAVLFMPVVFNIINAHRYGNIVQGRYMLPCAVGLTLVAAQVAKEVTVNVLSVTKTLVVLSFIGSTAAYLWVLRQYIVGLNTLDIFKAQSGHWSPPLPALLLMLFFTAINIMTLLWLWKMSEYIHSKYSLDHTKPGSLKRV